MVSLKILIPLLLVWFVGVPVALFIYMRREKYRLWKLSLSIKLGFLYSEYEESRYYWELVKVAQKSLMMITLSIYEEELLLKGVIIIIILQTYSYLTLMGKEVIIYLKNNLLFCFES